VKRLWVEVKNSREGAGVGLLLSTAIAASAIVRPWLLSSLPPTLEFVPVCLKGWLFEEMVVVLNGSDHWGTMGGWRLGG